MESKHIKHIISFLILVFSLSCHGQAVNFTFNHEADVFHQFSVMELGQGKFTPSQWYSIFHPDYKKTEKTENAIRKAKANIREVTREVFRKEPGKARSIKDTIRHRTIVELENTTTRNVNLDIMGKEKNFLSHMKVFKNNVNSINHYGGTAEDKTYWRSVYNCYMEGFNIIKESYLTPGQRSEEYIALDKDVVRVNGDLVRHLIQMRRLYEGKVMAQKLDRMRSGSRSKDMERNMHIVEECRDFWRDVPSLASMSGSSADRPTGTRRIGFLRK